MTQTQSNVGLVGVYHRFTSFYGDAILLMEHFKGYLHLKDLESLDLLIISKFVKQNDLTLVTGTMAYKSDTPIHQPAHFYTAFSHQKSTRR